MIYLLIRAGKRADIVQVKTVNSPIQSLDFTMFRAKGQIICRYFANFIKVQYRWQLHKKGKS